MDALANTQLASREWRICNLYTIQDDKGRLIPFQPNYAQRQFWNSFWFCNHILKARKLGFSTFIAIIYTDDLLFSDVPLTAGIIDYTIDDAEKKLGMMALAYDHLDNGDIHPDTWKIGRQIKRAIGMRATARHIEWTTGAKAGCSTSFRGSTPNRLHISELGKTAIWAPGKAREIINGAFNAMTPGNVRNIESTHEGGKLGEHYRLLNTAMRADPNALTEIESRFHFFPWFGDSRYVLPMADGRQIRPRIRDYFARLERDHDITCTPEQMLWYDRKHLEQGHGMKKEFPSTPGEAFEAISEGAIYGTEMADLRAAGRICDFGMERNQPVFTFWDIGLSDYISIWLIQPVGRAFLILDWFEGEGVPGSAMPDQMVRWETKWGKPIAGHYLPHDANTRSPNDGKTYRQTLHEGGLRNLRVVNRIPDIWLGIGYVRDVLPHCWFHKTHCDTPRHRDGTPHLDSTEEEFPSGIACLEGYTKDTGSAASLRIREKPRHDIFSHSADAFRTFAEAWTSNQIHFHESDNQRTKPRARR